MRRSKFRLNVSLEKMPSLQKRRSRSLVSNMYWAGYFPYRMRAFDVRKHLWALFCIFGLGYIVFGTAYSLRLKGSFLMKVATVKTVLSSFMCLVVQFVIIWRGADLTTFVKYVERNFYTYSDESRFRYKFSVTRKSEKLLVYCSSTYFFLAYSFAVLSHPIYMVFSRGLLHSKSKMLISTWLPWKGDTLFSFYLAHAILILFTIPVVVTIASNVCIILNVYLELKNQCERLTHALQTLTERVEEPAAKNSETSKHRQREYRSCDQFSEMINVKFERRLIECIRHYQAMRRCFLTFKKWFEITYSIILAHSVLTLAMMSYGALLNIKNFAVCIKYFSVLMVYTGQVYMYCYAGERIFDINEDLANVLYSIPWYRQPPKSRKLFYIFICQVQRPFRLHGIKIYDASFSIFSSIMKLSYSYLNLLRTYGNSLRKS